MKKSSQAVWILGLGTLIAAGAFAADPSSDQSAKQNGTQSTTQTDTTTTSSQSPGTASQGQSPSTAMTEVKVRDLNRHPEKFTGAPVAVSGKVDRIEQPGAFVLKGNGILNDKILVIVASNSSDGTANQQAGAAGPMIREGQKVQLNGKVETIGLTKVEEKYGPMKAEIKSEFEGVMPVLVVPPNGVKPAS
jgi:hypothetical protein